MENEGYGGKSLSLLSLSLAPSSPFFSPALSVLGNGSKVEKASTGKVRRGWSRLVSYLCRERTKWSSDEIGEVSLESGHSKSRSDFTAHAPTFSSLIARAVMSCPLTPRRFQLQQR